MLRWTLISLLCVVIVQTPAVCGQSTTGSPGQATDWNPSERDVDSWHLCSSTPPIETKLWPSVGNGHVATVVHSNAVYMNGLYNGNGTTSTRARIPAFISVDIQNISLPTSNMTYCLQMDNGVYVETYSGAHWSVELRVYAHRTANRLLVTELTVKTDGNQPALTVLLGTNQGSWGNQINFSNGTSGLNNTMYVYGATMEPEISTSKPTPVHIYYTLVPEQITVPAGQMSVITQTFLMSVSPLQVDAKRSYISGLAKASQDMLFPSHVTSWQALWDDGRVDIYGNHYLASLTYSALYYILSAMPLYEDFVWPFVGLSPADLAHNGYNGHVFWDQETWMYPPVLMMHADLGKLLVNTRIRTLDSAKEYARRSGLQGARYPWESALEGFDVTPCVRCSGEFEDHISGDIALAFRQYILATHPSFNDSQSDTILANLTEAAFAIADFWLSRVKYNQAQNVWDILGFDVTPSEDCSRYEVHITADIAQAWWQYLVMTGDISFLVPGRGMEAVFSIANYWLTRAVFNDSLGKYEIRDVMPPDEWNFPVNNSVYTNYIAQLALRLPAFVCRLTGCQVPDRYETVASNLEIPFDKESQYHPEYDGYNTSVKVKQADVILLGWPLDINMTEQIRRNDLDIYSKVTPAGPAMSWGMFCIGWLEVGETDKANETFYEQQKNRKGPFNIWTEDADGGGVTNFITGMGGYLQSLIFGYAGIRLRENSLIINCSPLPNTAGYRLVDIDYIGNSLDIMCNDTSTTVTLVKEAKDNLIILKVFSTGRVIDLSLRKPVTVTRQILGIFEILKLDATSPRTVLSLVNQIKFRPMLNLNVLYSYFPLYSLVPVLFVMLYYFS